MNARELQKCFGRFATGVNAAEGEQHGITVNALTPVSLNPPLLPVSIDRRAKACGKPGGVPFTVNILTAEQQDVALHFAGRPQDGLVPQREEGEAVPRMGGAPAWIEWDPWRACDGGDHILFPGEIKNFRYRDGQPPVFHTGTFARLSAALEVSA